MKPGIGYFGRHTRTKLTFSWEKHRSWSMIDGSNTREWHSLAETSRNRLLPGRPPSCHRGLQALRPRVRPHSRRVSFRLELRD